MSCAIMARESTEGNALIQSSEEDAKEKCTGLISTELKNQNHAAPKMPV